MLKTSSLNFSNDRSGRNQSANGITGYSASGSRSYKKEATDKGLRSKVDRFEILLYVLMISIVTVANYALFK